MSKEPTGAVMLINNGNQTFTVTQSGTPVFTGPLAAAMQLHAKLSYAARTPAKVTPRKQRRLAQIQEAKQAGL